MSLKGTNQAREYKNKFKVIELIFLYIYIYIYNKQTFSYGVCVYILYIFYYDFYV